MASIKESYIDYILAAQDETEAETFEIREWYEGRQFATLEKREEFMSPILSDILKRYPLMNLVKRTVGAVKERLSVESIQCTNDKKRELADKWWKSNALSSWQAEIYEAALRDRACVVIVGWDGIKKEPTFTKNELFDGIGGNCRIYYDENDNVGFISKRWIEMDETGIPTGRIRFTLYFKDQIARYVSDENSDKLNLMSVSELKKEDVSITKNPQPWIDSDGNPMGFAAVVFENRNYLSECQEAMGPQAGVNDALLDWHSSSRYHGIPTLIFSEVQFKIDPVTLKEVTPRWSPGRALAIDHGNVTRLQPVDMSTLFDGAVKPWIQVLAWQKGWPIHVFTSVPTSGETIRQLEGSLVAQVEDKKATFGDSWEELFNIAFKLNRMMNGEELEGDLEFKWKSALSISILYDLNILEKKAQIGDLPQRIKLKELGYSESEIETIIKLRDEEKAKAQADLLAVNESKVAATPNNGGNQSTDQSTTNFKTGDGIPKNDDPTGRKSDSIKQTN